jgi:carbamoyl-phosphate synthase large subunit
VKDLYRDRKVLVTGAAGVIGTPLVDILVKAGARVLSCDLEPLSLEPSERLRHIRGDANELSLQEVRSFAPEICFHLAATFERSVETEGFWAQNFRNNAALSHHIGSLLQRSPSVRRAVFASSYLIYDPASYSFATPRRHPVVLRETTPIQPRNLCGAAKLLHEVELEFLSQLETTALRCVSARIFRVYGKGSRDIVSRWIRDLVRDESAPLTAYRVEGMFDYIYADDVAEGLLRLGMSDAVGIVNLGRGEARSVAELLRALEVHFPRLRYEEVCAEIPFEAHQADMSRFRATTGWTPPTSLETGIARVVEHERALDSRGGSDADRAAQPAGVLITSAARKVPLVESYRAALAASGRIGRVFVADADPECVARRFADEYWEMPRLDVLPTDALVTFCRENGIRLIVPTRDGDVKYFAQHRDALVDAGVHVMVASAESVRDCLDKLAFARRCEAARIAAIPTFASLKDARAVLGDEMRLVVKERFGAGSRAAGLGLDPERAERYADTLWAPIFQPLAEGVEYSVDLYVNRCGQVVDAVPRIRTRVHAGESFISETVDAPRLIDQSVQLADSFRLRGHNVLQAFADGDAFRFIECNPRVGGASSLGFRAGLESPRWSIEEAFGHTPEPRLGSYRRGLRLVRHTVDLFEET